MKVTRDMMKQIFLLGATRTTMPEVFKELINKWHKGYRLTMLLDEFYRGLSWR